MSLPCHQFPGYVLKDSLEPAVVSARLMEAQRQFNTSDFQQNHDILIQTFVVQIMILGEV